MNLMQADSTSVLQLQHSSLLCPRYSGFAIAFIFVSKYDNSLSNEVLINLQMGSRYKGTMVEEPLHHSGDIPTPVDADASTSHQPPTEFSGEDDEIVECEGTTEAPMSNQPLPTAGMYCISKNNKKNKIRYLTVNG